MDVSEAIAKAIHARLDSTLFPVKPDRKEGKPVPFVAEGAETVKPAAVEIHEAQAEFIHDATWGRDYRLRKALSEIDLLLSFQRRVSFVAWEKSLCERPIRVDSVEGSPSCIVTLKKAVYGHTPRNQTVCEAMFTFDVKLGR